MKSKLVNVEAGRGLAALLVVLFHVDKFYFGGPGYWADGALGGIFRFGHAGVEFFFVLSGYIMLTVHRDDIGRPGRVLPFLQKRFDRIYPLSWAVMAITVTLFFLFPQTGRADYREPLTILESALLVGREPMNAVVFVSWTLWHEILFYALCALSIGLPRLGLPVFALWTLACVATPFLGFELPWPRYWTASINALFGVGVVAGLLLRRFSIPAPRLVLALGLAVFFGTGLVTDFAPVDPDLSHALFGLGSALALLGGVEAERTTGLKAPRWMVVLGSASFSVYLTHMLSLPFLAKVAARLGAPSLLPAWLGFILLVAGAVAAGILVHFAIEKRLLGLTRRLFPRASAEARAAAE